jgi:diaminohydroxyphosphoribosylaminopyrimidine deaminase/5-amino-6-(5-phosphoribosylamino)uracil reductase
MDKQDKQDEIFMQRALQLAQDTVALASPNPQVGCVLVRDNQIIAEGVHLYQNRDHAEIVALKQAGTAAKGATSYVTLEPCSHHGRTAPCADALIDAGIARVVVATKDPNPLVSGQGIAKLRTAGIEVTTGILEQPARRLNEAFAHFIQHNTPFVTLKAALSADGYLAPPPTSRTPGQPHWLTNPEARAHVQHLRHAADAILTGIGTVLADNPTLTDRSGVLGPNGELRRRPLLRVILDTHLRTPLHSQLVRTAANDLLIVTAPGAPLKRIEALRQKGAEVEILKPESIHLNLEEVLKILAHRNIQSLLLECGSTLNGAFLHRNLVDKVVLFYAPTKLGSNAIPFARNIASPQLIEQSLTSTTRSTFGTDTCITGYLHNPWQTSSR